MKTLSIFLFSLLLSIGVLARDPAQVRAFRHTHPCPSTGKTSGACPGYVVDHIKALDCGGPDRPSNMQWQTAAAAKSKDRWERSFPSCKHRTS